MTILFGAPSSILEAMKSAVQETCPALVAVRLIGQERCRWAPGIPPAGMTCWLLDGEPASVGDLLRAAGLTRQGAGRRNRRAA